MSSQSRTGGSGFVVDGHRIITNYHVVEDAVDIRLSKTGDFKRWRARVAALGPDVDLATLEVVEDAEGFFSDLTPVTWSDELAPLRSRVTVRGYPLGGTGLSVTEGVVSRIESKNYRLGPTSSMLPGTLLVIQIDAAINGGNSGGPAFDETDRVVGVAFQGIDNAQNIGYLIPASLARTYLASTRGSVSEFRLVDVPFRAMKLENVGLRHFLKVPDGASGGVVVAVSPLSALAPTNESGAALRIDDVIMAIDGQPIGDDLSVALRPGERVQVDCLLTHKVAGETTELHILRGGVPLTLSAKLAPLPPLLPRWHSFDCLPEWVVIGGLVFVPLTAPLIEHASGGAASSSSSLAHSAHDTYAKVFGSHGFRTKPDREIVMLIDVLSAGDVNHGYESYSYTWKELKTFNGEAVLSLAGLFAAWQGAASSEFLEFGFGAAATAWHRKLILDGALVRESEEQLLALHGIPARASAGVLAKTHRVALQAAGGANLPGDHATPDEYADLALDTFELG